MRQHDRVAGQDGLDAGFERHAEWGTPLPHTKVADLKTIEENQGEKPERKGK